MTNTAIAAANQIDAANKGQASQALLIQTYCNSVLQQPNVDFSSFPTLGKFQTEINTGLKTAQDHANVYLLKIQPNIITNITNIGNYYALHKAVATTLPKGATEKEWIDTLTALKEQSIIYQSDANAVVKSLQALHGGLATDSAAFAKVVIQLNAAVEGDKGVLSGLDDELGSIQGKIDGAIAGIVLSGLAIIGGVFLIAVGAIGDIVTGGAATVLVVAGIAVVAAGVGGEVASAVILATLNDQKAKLIQQKKVLKAEVKLAQGISSGYVTLGTQVKAAVTAATAMENAWSFLSGDLGALATDLNKGIIDTGALRTLFLTAANTVVGTVITDIETIKHQMTGVRSIAVPPGQTVGQAIVEAAQKQAA